MDNAGLLVVAMAEKCRSVIQASDAYGADLPNPLHPKHLLWMCGQIEKHAEDGPSAKLHRWIGFVQCAMIANRMLDFDEAKAMFDKAKIAHGETGDDLFDHLDPQSLFELDIGGES